MRRLVVLSLLVALVVAAPAAGQQPNVVVIVTDDQRIHTLGPSRTPHIWNLIRRPGVFYNDANVPTSVCCPSRASILTGLFSHSHGVYGNGGPFGGWPTFYANGMEERTIARALHDAGYRTGLVGKYLNGGPPLPGHVPVGWDVFQEVRSGYYNFCLSTGECFGKEPADYQTDVLRDRAVQFIAETPPGQPLFLYFAPYAPHAGSIAAPRHVGSWDFSHLRRAPRALRENMRDKPPWLRRLPRQPLWGYRRALERRADTMLAVDEAVAAIVVELEATGRLGDTLIVFLSDNGFLLGEHRITTKMFPYRLATQIPMLARWDGRLPAGAFDERLVLNVDVAPTIASAAGVPFAADGRDLAAPWSRPGFLLEAKRWEHLGGVPAYCGYRTKRFMFARYAGGFEELYDYRHDPHELRNVAGRPGYRRATKAMRRQAKQSCAPAPPGFSWR